MNALDGLGVRGNLMTHAIILLFVGSALLIFLYFWWHGRLDMDEEPAKRMLEEEEWKNEKQ